MAGKKPGGRPLSPHLGVYKWAPSMAVSIFHRVSGDGLAIVGGLMFLWWLGALAAGPDAYAAFVACVWHDRSEEHTSELQSLMRISYAVFCLKKKNQHHITKLTKPCDTTSCTCHNHGD